MKKYLFIILFCFIPSIYIFFNHYYSMYRNDIVGIFGLFTLFPFTESLLFAAAILFMLYIYKKIQLNFKYSFLIVFITTTPILFIYACFYFGVRMPYQVMFLFSGNNVFVIFSITALFWMKIIIDLFRSKN